MLKYAYYLYFFKSLKDETPLVFSILGPDASPRRGGRPPRRAGLGAGHDSQCPFETSASGAPGRSCPRAVPHLQGLAPSGHRARAREDEDV